MMLQEAGPLLWNCVEKPLEKRLPRKAGGHQQKWGRRNYPKPSFLVLLLGWPEATIQPVAWLQHDPHCLKGLQLRWEK